MAAAFIKRYGLGPNFKFNNLRKGTGATVAQVRQEIQAGKHTVDILLVSAPGFFAAAVKRGAFEKLDSGYWKNHEELAKAAGQYFDYPYVVVPLAYTFQPVWNTSCPGMANFNANSYADVVKPELKGKTIVSDITKSFTYTNTAISLAENHAVDMDAFWQKLKATDPMVEFRTEPKMQMVISCQRPLDMWNLSGRVYQNVLKKPELAKVLKIGSYKEGQVMLGNQAAVHQGRAASERRQAADRVPAQQGRHRHRRRGRGGQHLPEGLYAAGRCQALSARHEPRQAAGHEGLGRARRRQFKAVRANWQKCSSSPAERGSMSGARAFGGLRSRPEGAAPAVNAMSVQHGIAPASPARRPLSSRWRSLVTQESVATLIVSVIVAAAVMLPLFTLVVSSFQVLDSGGFDTTWGLDNYRTLFTDRVIPKAFVNTLVISAGSTVVATFFGVSLAWINARTNCPGRDRLEPFNLIPFFLSPFVGAIAWHDLASRQDRPAQ